MAWLQRRQVPEIRRDEVLTWMQRSERWGLAQRVTKASLCILLDSLSCNLSFSEPLSAHVDNYAAALCGRGEVTIAVLAKVAFLEGSGSRRLRVWWCFRILKV